jgi:hypothetical protein
MVKPALLTQVRRGKAALKVAKILTGENRIAQTRHQKQIKLSLCRIITPAHDGIDQLDTSVIDPDKILANQIFIVPNQQSESSLYAASAPSEDRVSFRACLDT